MMRKMDVSFPNVSASAVTETIDLGGVSENVVEGIGVTGMDELMATFEKDINSNYSLMIQGWIGESWFVQEPLEVEVQETDTGELLVRDHEFEFYGKGETLEEAIKDYHTAIKDHYLMYKEYLDENNHPPTRKLFRYLQSYVKKTPSMA